MPIPESVRNRKFYFTADELPDARRCSPRCSRSSSSRSTATRRTARAPSVPRSRTRPGSTCSSPRRRSTAWACRRCCAAWASTRRSTSGTPRRRSRQAPASSTTSACGMEDWVERTLTRGAGRAHRRHPDRRGVGHVVRAAGRSGTPRTTATRRLGHTVQGVRYTRRLIGEGRAEECQRATDKFYPRCLDIFGGVGTPNERQYLEHGHQDLTNNQTRKLWIRSPEARPGRAWACGMPADAWQGDRQRYPREAPSEPLAVYLDCGRGARAVARPWLVKLLRGWVR